MIEYYQIKQLAVTPVTPVLMEPETYSYQLTDAAFGKFPDQATGYYEYTEGTMLPGLLTNPTFMAGTGLMKVFRMYDGLIEWKTLTLMPDRMEEMNRASETYWIPKLKKYDCLDESAVVLPEGTVERLVIRHAAVPDEDIFQIRDTKINTVIVSLALAESISRRSIYGVGFERVEVI